MSGLSFEAALPRPPEEATWPVKRKTKPVKFAEPAVSADELLKATTATCC